MFYLIKHNQISSFYKNFFLIINVPIDAIFADISSIIDWFSRSFWHSWLVGYFQAHKRLSVIFFSLFRRKNTISGGMRSADQQETDQRTWSFLPLIGGYFCKWKSSPLARRVGDSAYLWSKLGNAGLIRDQRYRTDSDAGMAMPDWHRWLPEKMPMPD